jgi:hypothetical protein
MSVIEDAEWTLSSSSSLSALAIVDGTGIYAENGPHYSRRTPYSKTFTGVGREIVLITRDGSAVFASVYQKTPARAGSGTSRGRAASMDGACRFVWRNMLFRNLGPHLSSALIRSAVATTYREWGIRYGALPLEALRTEVDPRAVRSTNPGFCYLAAGFHTRRLVRGKIHLTAPCPTRVMTDGCACCPAVAR